MTLDDLFSLHYRPLRLRGRSESTVRLYRCTIRAFARWCGYPPTTDDLSDLMISRYLDDRAAVRSPFTAEKERTQLLALWRFAADRRLGGVSVRPEVPPGVLPERNPEAWSPDEMRRLLRAAAATRGVTGSVPTGLLFSALIHTIYDTAERIGAIMQTPAANYSRPTLLVLAEHRKGRRRDRVYHLSPEACDAMDRLPANRDRLIPWPYCRTYLWSRFGEIVRRAGLDDGRRSRFHKVRRTVATAFAAAGGNATELLDHASPRTTAAYLDRTKLPGPPSPAELLPRLTDAG